MVTPQLKIVYQYFYIIFFLFLYKQIPDAGQEFTKHEIMDYFFITVSQKLSEIYPCYYKVNIFVYILF